MSIPAPAGERPARRPRTRPSDRIVRTSSGEHVVRHIRRLIFEGDLKPGMRVPQDEIAEHLGVSRIPVREALIALEREGWVTIELHRGAFINALDERAVHDHYELYGLFFGFAAERALDRSGPELLARLDVLQAQIAATDDPEELSPLFIAFNRAVIEGAASPRIEALLRAMSTLVPGNFFDAVPDSIAVEKAGMRTILRALRRGDGAKAAAEYQRMMRRIGDQVARLFNERGLLGPGDTA
jgi:DNA-binding GntR family transcriptional regulator